MSNSTSFPRWIGAEPGFQPPGASWYPIEYPEPERALPKIKRGRNKIDFSSFALSSGMLTGPLSNLSSEASEANTVSAPASTYLVPANQIRSSLTSKKRDSPESTSRYNIPEDIKKRPQDPNRMDDPNRSNYSNLEDPNSSKRNEWRSHTFVLKPRLAPKTPDNFINTSTASFSPINKKGGPILVTGGTNQPGAGNGAGTLANTAASNSPTGASPGSITSPVLSESPVLTPKPNSSSSPVTRDLQGTTSSISQTTPVHAKVGRPPNSSTNRPISIKPITWKPDEMTAHHVSKIVPIAPHPELKNSKPITPRISFTHSSPPEPSKMPTPTKRSTTEALNMRSTGHKLASKKHKQLVIKLKTNYSETLNKSEDSDISEPNFYNNGNEINGNEYEEFEDENSNSSPAVEAPQPKTKRKYTKRIRSTSPSEPVKRRYRKSRLVGNDTLPAQVSQSTHNLDPSIENDDFCSTCGGIGEFLCCEGCPKSFHFDCLDPPLEADSLPEGQWFCQECQTKRAPPLSYKRGLFSQLLTQLDKRNPTVFMLPINLKERFRPEEANAKALKKKPKRGRPKKKSKSKAAKVSFRRAEIKREQQQNDTPEPAPTSEPSVVDTPDDGTDKLHSLFIQNYEQDRLTDRTGKEIFCSVCHSSTISATPIARCEECDQNWHLTCTDPPLSKNLGVKLFCPNNGTHRLRKLRRPKNLTIHELELADKDKPDSEKLADDPWLLRKKTHEFHLKKRYVDNPKPGTNKAGLKDLVGGSVHWKRRASATRETPAEKETPTMSSSEDEEEDEDDEDDDEDEDNDTETHIRHLPIHMYYDTPTGVVAPVLHNRFKQLERDGVVYRISSRGIKADFIQAVYEMNQNPLPDSKNSEILLALDEIAGRDVHGVSRTVPNIELLVDCALGQDEATGVAEVPSTVATVKTEDDPSLVELMAVKKLIDIRGKDALLKFLLK